MTKFYKNLDATQGFTGTLDKSKIHDAISFNKMATVGLVLTILLSAVCGSFLSGWLSFFVSIGFSIIGLGVGYYAYMKIRIIERYIDAQPR